MLVKTYPPSLRPHACVLLQGGWWAWKKVVLPRPREREIQHFWGVQRCLRVFSSRIYMHCMVVTLLWNYLLCRIYAVVLIIFIRRLTPSQDWPHYMAGVLEEWQWGCSAISGLIWPRQRSYRCRIYHNHNCVHGCIVMVSPCMFLV